MEDAVKAIPPRWIERPMLLSPVPKGRDWPSTVLANKRHLSETNVYQRLAARLWDKQQANPSRRRPFPTTSELQHVLSIQQMRRSVSTQGLAPTQEDAVASQDMMIPTQEDPIVTQDAETIHQDSKLPQEYLHPPLPFSTRQLLDQRQPSHQHRRVRTDPSDRQLEMATRIRMQRLVISGFSDDIIKPEHETPPQVSNDSNRLSIELKLEFSESLGVGDYSESMQSPPPWGEVSHSVRQVLQDIAGRQTQQSTNVRWDPRERPNRRYSFTITNRSSMGRELDGHQPVMAQEGRPLIRGQRQFGRGSPLDDEMNHLQVEHEPPQSEGVPEGDQRISDLQTSVDSPVSRTMDPSGLSEKRSEPYLDVSLEIPPQSIILNLESRGRMLESMGGRPPTEALMMPLGNVPVNTNLPIPWSNLSNGSVPGLDFPDIEPMTEGESQSYVLGFNYEQKSQVFDDEELEKLNSQEHPQHPPQDMPSDYLSGIEEAARPPLVDLPDPLQFSDHNSYDASQEPRVDMTTTSIPQPGETLPRIKSATPGNDVKVSLPTKLVKKLINASYKRRSLKESVVGSIQEKANIALGNMITDLKQIAEYRGGGKVTLGDVGVLLSRFKSGNPTDPPGTQLENISTCVRERFPLELIYQYSDAIAKMDNI